MFARILYLKKSLGKKKRIFNENEQTLMTGIGIGGIGIGVPGKGIEGNLKSFINLCCISRLSL